MYRKELGQFFTVNESLQNFIFENVKYKNQLLLEPSFGVGHLLQKFKSFNENYPIEGFEIDSGLKPIISQNEFQTFHYEDFLKFEFEEHKKFRTIVANPPYIKSKGKNIYIQFIEKCFELLEEDGEMLFIIPSDFIKLTSASKLIQTMVNVGSFTHFLFPNNENLFLGASIDVLCFRYEKGLKIKECLVNDKIFFIDINEGIITFNEKEINDKILISDLFDVLVGFVSGKDEVFRNENGNIDILINKDKIERYILIESYPSGNHFIDTHLTENKYLLMSRKIKVFSEKNWFEWGALRNKKKIDDNLGKLCIYLKNLTRDKEVAFVGKVQYFGGGLICLIPKVGMNEFALEKYIKLLNSERVISNYTYSGRFKIGQKQVCNICI